MHFIKQIECAGDVPAFGIYCDKCVRNGDRKRVEGALSNGGAKLTGCG